MPVLLNKSSTQDQLAYLTEAKPGNEAVPAYWKGHDAGFDWSCTRARRRRFNNLAPIAPDASDIRGWNSGYFAVVLISPMHGLCCGHYLRAVPSQVNDLLFLGRFGREHRPVVKEVITDIGDDLDLIEFAEPLPPDVGVCSRIADLRTAKKGTPVLLQTSQMMTVMMVLDAVGTIVETGGASFAHSMKLSQVRNGTDDMLEAMGSPYFFSGDSGSPVMALDAEGQQCLVGFHAGGGPIGIGGSKWPGDEFERLSERVKARGYQIHAVELGGKPIDFVADVDGDGKVGASDVAAVLTHWGEPGGPYDVTRDGLVDAKDLGAVLAGWNA